LVAADRPSTSLSACSLSNRITTAHYTRQQTREHFRRCKKQMYRQAVRMHFVLLPIVDVNMR